MEAWRENIILVETMWKFSRQLKNLKWKGLVTISILYFYVSSSISFSLIVWSFCKLNFFFQRKNLWNRGSMQYQIPSYWNPTSICNSSLFACILYVSFCPPFSLSICCHSQKGYIRRRRITTLYVVPVLTRFVITNIQFYTRTDKMIHKIT